MCFYSIVLCFHFVLSFLCFSFCVIPFHSFLCILKLNFKLYIHLRDTHCNFWFLYLTSYFLYVLNKLTNFVSCTFASLKKVSMVVGVDAVGEGTVQAFSPQTPRLKLIDFTQLIIFILDPFYRGNKLCFIGLKKSGLQKWIV